MDTLRAVLRHTPLMLGLILGALTATVLALMGNTLTPLTRALLAWDIGVFAYLLTVAIQTRGITARDIKDHAAATEDGKYFVLFVSLGGVLASLTAIVLDLQAQLEPGAAKSLHVGFVFLTVALSWLFVHTSFAKHYAHEYYGPTPDKENNKDVREGLIFPGGEPPDFGDFFHFALVIGVAAQTADIQITAKTIRHVVTLHGVLAFVFNTVILALTINLAAGLFN